MKLTRLFQYETGSWVDLARVISVTTAKGFPTRVRMLGGSEMQLTYEEGVALVEHWHEYRLMAQGFANDSDT